MNRTQPKASHQINYIILPIEGMTCASCVSRVEKSLQGFGSVHSVNVNLAAEQAAIGFEGAPPDTGLLIERVLQSGYDVKREKIIHELTGLSDPAEARKIEQELNRMTGILSAAVNTAAESLALEIVPGLTDLESVGRILAAFGYKVTFTTKQTDVTESFIRDKQRFLKMLGFKVIAGLLLSALVMLLTMPEIFSFVELIPLPTRLYAAFILTSVVLFGAGIQFFTGFYKALRARTADMNSLVAIGSGAAYFYSAAITFFPALFSGHSAHLHVYYDTAAMITAFILLGRYLEARAKYQTTGALRSLVALQPRRAHVFRNGQLSDIESTELAPGEICLVKSGGHVPADGILLDTEAELDEAMLTGESMPVMKKTGDLILGGTISIESTFKMRALKTGAETALSRIIRLVREAQGSKPQIQRQADKIAAVFTPLTLIIALLVFSGWYWAGAGFTQSMMYFIAVVIIACPCAMGLATPAAIIVATGRGAREGILVRNADTLQNFSKINRLFFDKTGTLTSGRMSLQQVIALDENKDKLLTLAASLEAHSGHPIAQAIVNAAKDKNLELWPAEQVRIKKGLGLEGMLRGNKIAAGNRAYLERQNIAIPPAIENEAERLTGEAQTPVYISIDGRVAGMLTLSDEIRPMAAAVIGKLNSMGITPALVSGDNARTAKAVGMQIGIKEIFAERTPERKAQLISEYQNAGQKTAMIGDGINDAVALAQSDIGIAIGGGTDVAMEAADLVLMHNDLSLLLKAHRLSVKSQQIIRQNFIWAFGYNVIMIPAAAGLLHLMTGLSFHPMAAALAMSLSSVSVVLNSLRLRNISLEY
jgi:Cu+-exporting ATPase